MKNSFLIYPLLPVLVPLIFSVITQHDKMQSMEESLFGLIFPEELESIMKRSHAIKWQASWWEQEAEKLHPQQQTLSRMRVRELEMG